MIKIIYKFFCGLLVLAITTVNANTLSAANPDRNPFVVGTETGASGTTPALAAIIHRPNARLAFDFHDIAVRDLLELLAEFKDINLIVSDSVTGHLTLRLEDVTWEQALTTVLTMQGLSEQQQQGILFIAPAQEMLSHTEEDLQTAPLLSNVFPISYTNAADLATLLQNKTTKLLSARGSCVVDARTNTLWITDTATALAKIRQFLQAMDVPAKQILIAARIVNVDEDSVEELGLKFGTTSTTTTDQAQQLYMDTPTDLEDVGHFTVAIAKLGEDALLNLQLAALEREGHARLISSPELITSNRQPALIESGEEIPYQEKTSSGATSASFKKAVLSLQVTPQVTLNNQILLNLLVNQNKVSVLSVNGVPGISTQHVQTQIRVKNGETIVLGGIYEESNSRIRERVPFWGDIPLLGALFTNKQTHSERKELLIFVTPKIINNE